MKKTVCAALASAALLLAVPAAQATEGFYGSLSTGLTVARNSNWNDLGFGGKITVGNAPNFGAALGLKVTPNFRSELELSYRQANLNSISVNGVGSASLGGHLTTWGMLANGYYDFLPDDTVSPFLSAGLGMARHSGTIDSVGSLGFSAVSASSNVFAYQLGAGLDFNISKQTALFAAYRYFGTTNPNFDGLKASYGAHEFRAGLRQSFD
jgi:opacity protein-like surface antigen